MKKENVILNWIQDLLGLTPSSITALAALGRSRNKSGERVPDLLRELQKQVVMLA